MTATTQRLDDPTTHHYRGIIERYRSRLPVSESTPIITLLEGNTPLIPAPRLAEAISPYLTIYLKFEGLNPTGSFKDRGMTVAVSKAAEEGKRMVMCASTGNTSASAAAYAARAGMRCAVLIPEGKIALGKLAQAVAHGAKVISVEGNFDQALELVRDISESEGIALVNSINPHRLEGQKTAAFEIIDTLGFAPDYHALPVGNAGNITAYWRGYREYLATGVSASRPKMLGFQAAGSAPIVKGKPVREPETVATAIRIGNPANWSGALAARDESEGLIESVSDEQILEAYFLLASREGVFAEPACGAPIAGIRQLAGRGYFSEPAIVVITLTGHGLKDPATATSASHFEQVTVPPNRGAVMRALM